MIENGMKTIDKPNKVFMVLHRASKVKEGNIFFKCNSRFYNIPSKQKKLKENLIRTERLKVTTKKIVS